MTLQITDATGKVKIFRNTLHKWAASNPFTAMTITAVVALVVGFILG